jgi:hypothetical protein
MKKHLPEHEGWGYTIKSPFAIGSHCYVQSS